MTLTWKTRDQADWPVGYTYLAIFIIGVFWAKLMLSQLHLVCPFKHLFGVPCPTCGMTRGLNLFLAHRPMDAFWSNPGAFLGITVLLAYFILEIVGFHLGKKPVLKIKASQRPWFVGALVVLFMLNWGYLIATGR